MKIEKKVCSRCNYIKPVTMFSKWSKYKFRPECKTCTSEYYYKNKHKFKNRKRPSKEEVRLYNKEYREKNKKTLKNKILMTKYGVTPEEYKKLSSLQEGKCKICDQKETRIIKGVLAVLSVDHCHKSNKVRGLLCSRCNLGLGHFKDNIQNLENAIRYLKSMTNL